MPDKRFNPGLILGALLCVLLVFGAVSAPLISPHPPAQQHLAHRLEGPSLAFPLGTDSLGRCVASRILYGLRPSLGLAFTVTVLVSCLGLCVGMLAAGFRFLDGLLMRLTDCFFAFPGIVMALICISILGPGINSLILALALPGWPKYARVVRSTALGLCKQGYVEATKAAGGSPLYVLRRCILPGVLPPVATIATLGLGGKIIQVAALGFLGLGVQPPTPEWGTMLIKGLPVLGQAPHISLSATTAIAFTVLAFTLLGEGLRDSFDPRSGWTEWRFIQTKI